MRGYDASNEPVVQFEQRTAAADDAHGSVEVSVTREGITTAMRVDVEVEAGPPRRSPSEA